MAELCRECENRECCSVPCKPVQAELRKCGQVMERHYSDMIKVYPLNHEVQFSTLRENVVDEMAEGDGVELCSDFIEHRRTGIFVDRFFHKLPYSEISEKYDTTPDKAAKMYSEAKESAHELIQAMAMRKSGMKDLKQRVKFTKEQKWFLMAFCFGYTNREIADLYGVERTKVSGATRKIALKYKAAFDQVET